MSPETSNREVLLYCLFRLGGGGDQVGLEALFEECWKVAPSRFGWNTKPYPSDKSGDQALRAILRDDDLRGLVNLSPDRGSARLTAEGVAWVREHQKKLDQLAEKRAPSESAPSATWSTWRGVRSARLSSGRTSSLRAASRSLTSCG